MKKIRDFWKKNTFNKVIAIVIVFTIIGMFIEIFSPNEVKNQIKNIFMMKVYLILVMGLM